MCFTQTWQFYNVDPARISSRRRYSNCYDICTSINVAIIQFAWSPSIPLLSQISRMMWCLNYITIVYKKQPKISHTFLNSSHPLVFCWTCHFPEWHFQRSSNIPIQLACEREIYIVSWTTNSAWQCRNSQLGRYGGKKCSSHCLYKINYRVWENSNISVILYY